jgi:hypothetical protein
MLWDKKCCKKDLDWTKSRGGNKGTNQNSQNLSQLGWYYHHSKIKQETVQDWF